MTFDEIMEAALLAIRLQCENAAPHVKARWAETAEGFADLRARLAPPLTLPPTLPVAPSTSTASRGQQVADFEGIGPCFFEHVGVRFVAAGDFYGCPVEKRALRAKERIFAQHQVVRPTHHAIPTGDQNWPFKAGALVRLD
jgi:hypothetical protein